MISVATPANKVYSYNRMYNNEPYYTFKSDCVIALTYNALSANIYKKKPGFCNHAFVDDYLEDEHASGNILSSVYQAIKKSTVHSNEGEDVFSHYANVQSLKVEDAYYNTDMNSVLTWFDHAIENNINATPADCVVAFALFGVHRRHSLTCAERNLAMLKWGINECILDWKDTKHLRNESGCSIHAVDDPFNVFAAFWPSERYTFFDNNKFCEFRSREEYEKKITVKDLEDALGRFE